MARLDVRITYADGIITIFVAGEIDIATSEDLRDHLDMVGGYVVLDLTDVPLLDSSGIAVIEAGHRRLVGRGGDLTLRGARPNVFGVLERVGLDGLIEGGAIDGQVVPIELIATRIAEAFSTADVGLLGGVLAENAIFGRDDSDSTYGGRSEILAAFGEVRKRGVNADIVEMNIGRCGVACQLEVERLADDVGAQRYSVYNVYFVDDGLITEIQRFEERESALSAIHR
jgi:anti-anti-sigma factor